MPLPLVKLGTLAIRSFIAKPLASYVKAKAGSSSSKYREYMIKFGQMNQPPPQGPQQPQICPRESSNTKFSYFNNCSLSKPRYRCKTCKRHLTLGGTLRNVPVGGGSRKTKQTPTRNSLSSSSSGLIDMPSSHIPPISYSSGWFSSSLQPFNQVGNIVNESGANHRMMTKMQRRNIGRATNAEIHPLDVEKAVQITADFIGEFVLYGVAGVLLSLEYWRSIASEARKEDVRRQELGAIKLSVEDLAGQIEQHRKREEYLVREIETMKHEFEEVKQLAKGRGLAGAFSFKQAPVATKDPKPTATSSPTS
ncbi:hypothetical protein GIB67_015638 [Kingdonia uniflora]|uniref:Dof-type domain-containing protein n=1 Tax=Kingdonia uniflora TaxID=39325 RepID=A0A7J7NU16_9MAGN|nr:hypothetical protein GIB67_015638 [Kingdonia uniflora]